jgi:hypothetical protein
MTQTTTTDPIVDHHHNPNQWITVTLPSGLVLQQCSVGGEIDLDMLDSSVSNTWQGIMVEDLDRCPHGRHEGDPCDGWTGPGMFDGGCYGGTSAGFPKRTTGHVVAYGLVKERDWVMPLRQNRHDPQSWRRPS